jgi:hypothetical protein
LESAALLRIYHRSYRGFAILHPQAVGQVGRWCCSRHFQIHAKEASQQIITNEAFLNCTSHARGINDRSFQPWQKHIIPWLHADLFLGQ